MRPVVALLRTRPETIDEDYSRLVALAQLNTAPSLENALVAMEARRRTWFPGLVCPPWQVSGVLNSLRPSEGTAASGGLLVPVSDSGPLAKKSGQKWGWEETLSRLSTEVAGDTLIDAVPYRPISLLPALEGVWDDGVKISPHFRGKDLVMLSSMGLESGGQLNANMELLSSLLVGQRKTKARIPEAEVLSELVGLAKEVFSSISVVTDATVWSLARRGGTRVPLVRNLLVAGNDLVAVDSVLAKLAGLNPSNLPWLALSESRGLGVADLSKINIVGEPECMNLDFRIPEDTFASGNKLFGVSPGALWSRMIGRNSVVNQSPADSAWTRLFKDYQSGVNS